MSPMLELIDIARLEEARVARGVSEIADDSRPFAGGTMNRASPGSWPNAAYGAGFNGPVEPGEVRTLVDYYTSRGIEPRVELAPFADPSLVRHLAAEGFVVKIFENVFYRPLAHEERFTTPHQPPAGLTIRRINPDDAALVDEYARIAISGFMPDGVTPPDDLVEAARRVARHARTTAVSAFLGGRMVAAGAVEVAGDIAALFGVSVIPEARRMGVQQAMLAWRLRYAAENNARFATIGARPGIATERNARRMGFQVAYTKAILIRPGEGLVGVLE